VHVATGDASRRQSTRRIPITLHLALEVFVLQLVVEVGDARMLVPTLPWILTIDDRIALDKAVVGK